MNLSKYNVVCKFGGTSVASAKNIKKVSKIIKENPDRRAIIFSAPGKRNQNDIKITDLLIKLDEAVKKNKPSKNIFNQIKNRFVEIRDELKINFKIEKPLDDFYKKVLEGKSYDYTVSRGEYFNALLISKYLGFTFVDAKNIIKFNSDKKVDEVVSKTNLKKYFKDNKNYVIPGFYGSDKKGKVIAFSRGGSDITGSIISSLLNAKLYENWTDVSGFMMADPRIVDKPKSIKELTFDELRELSYMGAKVLHEESVFPLRDKKTQINIKNTNIPTDKGTLISKNRTLKKTEVITGISGRKGYIVLAIYKNMMAGEINFPFKVLNIFNELNIRVEHIPSGIDTISVIISKDSYLKKEAQINKMIERELKPNKITIIKNLALIATVGEGMAKRKGTAAKLFTSLRDKKINVKLIDQGSSEMNIIIGVDESDYKNAINAIYNAFVK